MLRSHSSTDAPPASVWRAAAVGARAAFAVPRLVAGPALAALLVPVPEDRAPHAARRASDPAEVRLATRIALGAIARLARLPGRRWRNSCLYRAAAECVVLRAEGLAAVLRIGVARPGPEGAADGVVAHAWVECGGLPCATADGSEGSRYVLLERAADTLARTAVWR